MGAIAIRDVVKRYGSGAKANQVIHGVNAEIADGEFVVIVGPSGCGKSTVLRIASGLLDGATGRWELADANIGYVFPDPTLLPWVATGASSGAQVGLP